MSKRVSYQTMESNTIRYMEGYVLEYEEVKAKRHKEFKIAREFFKARKICFQNFYKFYNRYISSGRNVEALLPTRRGPRPKYVDMPISDCTIVEKILAYRKLGYNKYIISESLKRDESVKSPCSASTVYRILYKHGVSRLNITTRQEHKKIVREYAGSLVHLDCHYLPKGVVKAYPEKRYYVVGAIDDFSRIVWVEVSESVKALDVTFAMMDIIMLMNERYGIKFDEVLTDNGSEFCSNGKEISAHPFERLLMHFAIKHRRTKPYRPQTNGKIERFWRSFHEDVIDGSVFETLDELKDAVLGYNFFHNEHRPHQGIGGKIPVSMVSRVDDITIA